MNTKRILTMICCLALLIGLLAGCSAQAPSGNGQSYDAMEKPGANLSGPNLEAPGNVTDNRKLIRKITMNAETEDMDALLQSVGNHIATLGGYIESRNVQSGSAYTHYHVRSATLVIRIPADQLDAFLLQMDDAAHIVSTVESSDDVTMEYVDTESRLKVLRTEEERVLKFLSEASSVTEMLEIEKRLTQIQSEIESLTSKLNKYDDLVSYGTVTLNIEEVEVFTEVEKEDPTMWEQIQKGFTASLNSLLAVGRAIIVFLLSASPWLVVLGLIGLGIWLFIRAYDRRQQKKRAPRTPKDPE